MFFEEVEEGKTYIAELKKPITGSEIDIFAQMSGMYLPGFLDAEFAKSWGFKDRVTPGAYLIASMMGLMSKQGFLADAVWVAATDVSFRTPVLPLDKIGAQVEVVGKKPIKHGGLVTYKWTIKNQRDELVATGTNT